VRAAVDVDRLAGGPDSDLVAGLTAEEQEVLIPLPGKLWAFARARSA
jgi:hypothetical protein